MLPVEQGIDFALSDQTVEFPKAQGYGVLVGEAWFRLAPDDQAPVRIYSKDSLAPRQDDRGSVYENVLDVGYAWSRGDLSGGEGLDWDPRLISKVDGTDALDRIRFFDSDNINIQRPIKGEMFRISLANQMEIWSTYPDLVDLDTSDDWLFVAEDDVVEWWDNWDAGAFVGSATASSTIVMIAASPHGDVAALLDDGSIELCTKEAGVFSAAGAFTDATGVWYAKGRFIVATTDSGGDGALYELDNPTQVVDTFRGSCLDVIDSGPAIVAAVSDGTIRTYLPEQGNADDATSVNLVIRGRVDALEGEIPYALGSNAGIMLILTRSLTDTDEHTVRAYQAEVLSSQYDYSVGQLQLKREWEDVVENFGALTNIAATRDEMWFVLEENTDEHSLWRFDVVTTGLTRHLTSALTADVTSTVSFADKIAFISGTNVMKQSDLYANYGWLITPNITYGLNTTINWFALALTAYNLVQGGAQVELLYSTNPEAILDHEHSSWQPGIRLSAPPNNVVEHFLTQVSSSQCALQLRVYSAESDTRTPKITNFAVRGFPAHRDWMLDLPVNVSDWVEVPFRRPQHSPGLGNTLHRYLLNIVGQSMELHVLDPPMVFRGVIDNIIEPATFISDRGSVSTRAIVQCRGARTASTSGSTAPTGDAGLGLGLLGIEILGIGQTERT